MTKEQMRERLYTVFRHYRSHRLSDECLSIWWFVFRQVDKALFGTALRQVHLAGDGSVPPTIQAVSRTLAELDAAKLRDVAPHSTKQAVAFLLSLARTHSRPAAHRAATPFPIILETLERIGYDEISVLARGINFGSRASLSTLTNHNSETKEAVANTYAALRLWFFETRDLKQVLTESDAETSSLPNGIIDMRRFEATRCRRDQ